MFNGIIKLLGGATVSEFNAINYACNNAYMLKNQTRDRAEKLEQELEKMEDNCLRAYAQVEQLQELLNQTERRLENAEEERSNVSVGWNEEISAHARTTANYQASHDAFSEVVNERDQRIAELNTLIAKESDHPKIVFDVRGGDPVAQKKGSHYPLRLIMAKGDNTSGIELRSLSYSKANRKVLDDIAALANGVVR